MQCAFPLLFRFCITCSFPALRPGLRRDPAAGRVNSIFQGYRDSRRSFLENRACSLQLGADLSDPWAILPPPPPSPLCSHHPRLMTFTLLTLPPDVTTCQVIYRAVTKLTLSCSVYRKRGVLNSSSGGVALLNKNPRKYLKCVALFGRRCLPL